MIINFVLMFACGGLAVKEFISMRKGHVFKPLRMVAAIIVFLMAIVATVMGLSVTDLQYILEGKKAMP